LDFYIKETQTYGFLLYNYSKTIMTKSFYRSFFSFVLIGFLFIALPIKTYAESFNNIGDLFLVSQQKTIINYEKSQPSSIDNPVVDPNFNSMRAEDTENSTATYIVIGLLVAATIIPLATWWYFSK
tara:strand:+ start:384 stop:761 length:378 start_codon:yes stop_codon:yes gene_type:complete